MPGRDGTGLGGQGPGTGRGVGRSQGGNRPGAGPGGNCVCPNYGATAPHQAGQPCYQVQCPKCGAQMARQ